MLNGNFNDLNKTINRINCNDLLTIQNLGSSNINISNKSSLDHINNNKNNQHQQDNNKLEGIFIFNNNLKSFSHKSTNAINHLSIIRQQCDNMMKRKFFYENEYINIENLSKETSLDLYYMFLLKNFSIPENENVSTLKARKFNELENNNNKREANTNNSYKNTINEYYFKSIKEKIDLVNSNPNKINFSLILDILSEFFKVMSTNSIQDFKSSQPRTILSSLNLRGVLNSKDLVFKNLLEEVKIYFKQTSNNSDYKHLILILFKLMLSNNSLLNVGNGNFISIVFNSLQIVEILIAKSSNSMSTQKALVKKKTKLSILLLNKMKEYSLLFPKQVTLPSGATSSGCFDIKEFFQYINKFQTINEWEFENLIDKLRENCVLMKVLGNNFKLI